MAEERARNLTIEKERLEEERRRIQEEKDSVEREKTALEGTCIKEKQTLSDELANSTKNYRKHLKLKEDEIEALALESNSLDTASMGGLSLGLLMVGLLLGAGLGFWIQKKRKVTF